ncbi:MAG: MarR family transcriptional regulator [Lachnospiraceae bacterium]|nr:MarR family transcriptional regulator [Lachnospiraceae bacterium]
MDNNTREQIDLIIQKTKELSALYREAAYKSGVSDGEVAIWSVLLNGNKAYSQQDIAEILFLPKQTVNSLISRMARKGYLTLEHAPGTRNRKIIQLTEIGRHFGEQQIQWIFKSEKKAMEDTNPTEVTACVSMLEKYIVQFRKEIEQKNSYQEVTVKK